MPLTPTDVHNVVFRKPAMGRRGYDGDEVDAFCEVVEAELARLIEENIELRASGGGGAPVEPEESREDDSVRASRILALATETADRCVNEAKAMSEQMLSSATTNSDRLMTDARQNSEQMVAETQHRAGSMMGQARTRAETIEREARTHAADLVQDAERRHVEAICILEEKRSSLEREVAELRTSEREYRTRLRSHLESHLRDLDSGSAEPASNTSNIGQSQPLVA